LTVTSTAIPWRPSLVEEEEDEDEDEERGDGGGGGEGGIVYEGNA